MKLSLLSLGLCAAMGVEVGAANSARASFTRTLLSSTSTTERCMTRSGSTSVASLPTTTSTHTLFPGIGYLLTTSTPTSTATPPQVTATTTTTTTLNVTTTASTPTDTITATSTVSVTSVVSVTTNTTVVSTSTTTVSTTSTTTIPAPSGYVPIASVLGISGSSRKARRDAEPQPRPAPKSSKPNSVDPAQYFANSKYPKSVSCVDYVQVDYMVEVIKVFPATTTTLAPVTTTGTVTATATSTSTVYPQTVSTTVTTTTSTTVTTTSMITSTISSTTVSTVTYSTTTSVYAACTGSANVVPASAGYNVNGFGLGPGGGGGGSGATTGTSDTNGYDCCVACQLAGPSCVTSAYGPNGINYAFDVTSTGTAPQCNLYTATNNASPNACSANQLYYQVGQINANYTAAISNGPCSQTQRGQATP